MGDTTIITDADQNLLQRLHQALTADRDKLFAMLQGQPLEELLAVPRLTSAQKELVHQALGRHPTT